MGKTIQLSGFPYLVPAEDVKKFLEGHTRQGTIIALEVKEPKRGTRPYARVQFAEAQYADSIIQKANSIRRLYYGSSYLRAWESDKDIIPNTKTYVHEMEQVTLNFGCQVSRERFSVLWKAESVSVKFGTGMKKMQFFLCHDLVEYKLQLSYENIWQIVLYNSRSHTGKLLVIQLFGAPRIYKKLKESILCYYSVTQDDQWIRTTDFTPSRIGQSSGLCIQLPYGMRLPNLKDNFVYYKESQDPFSLQTGLPFANTNSSLVPIINPPRGFDLPYRILFKICSLVQTGCLPGPNLDSTFFRLIDPKTSNIRYIEHALEKMYYLKECCYGPTAWLSEQYEKYRTFKEQPSSPSISLDDGLVYVHRVQITPTRVYFSGPEVNMSNRVLRHYKDHTDNFLRVSFVDEEWEKMYSTDLAPKVAVSYEDKRTKLYERVISTLRDGITIGNKKFDFLAFSSSQLRDNSLWMFAPNNYLDADGIRQWMGDFRSIRNVAKYAARLGQSFGSSTETLTVNEYDVENIDDIKDLGNKYTFSDGIGKISADFARRVAIKCGFKGSTPSAFQIRYGGYKGVVAVDPFLNKKLSLRPSMLKYQSDNKKLDVLSWSKYQPCFLNRQIITLLSTLGVRDHVFEEKQREAVAQLDDILVDPVRAQEALDLMYPGENTNILKEMLKCGYKPNGEPFLSMMLQTFRSSKLLDLRLRARVFIPRARQMMGCLDETGTLRYGQVFVQYSGAGRGRFDDEESDNCTYIVQGKVCGGGKTRACTLGTFGFCKAVNVPALHHMVDCLVFSLEEGRGSRGVLHKLHRQRQLRHHRQRAHRLRRQRALHGPERALPRARPIILHRRRLPKNRCPAEIPPHLRVKEYPDFMDKPDKTTYVSTRVIGKLFREVKDKAPRTATITSFTKDVAAKSYDRDLEVDGFHEYVDEAFDYKTDYDYKLGNLMDYYGIKTEAEILSGGIMKMSKTFDRRKDAEAIGAAVRSLRSEARSWFKKGSESDDVYAKASAWYHVTYHLDFWGSYNEGLKRDHYISFPWCVYDTLVKIKKDRVRRAKEAADLERDFRRRLGLR
ncbi:RNA-dependent RNA polymerase 1 [Phtheirospermum japonicum]|uniref:RNA-dependent RNA polymerase n=1 Tax=Phtheirospermum japonicum TaxID=374723 RepID=A0A830D9M6_9LAMI|nr:RNA-dependent RNA polymerase 1 [Phtheirospermum japonicum]